MTEESRWHLKKEVNLAHLLVTISIIAALFSWSAKMDTRVAVLETQNMIVNQQVNEFKGTVNQQMNEIKGALTRIENKLDNKRDKER